MNKSVLITGMPGTGKTIIADELTKRGYVAIDFEEIHGLCRLIHKETKEELTDYNLYKELEAIKQFDYICDINRLKSLIKENSGKGIVFYCGIPSNIFDIANLFDQIIMLTASNDVLSQRLSSRNSNPKDFGHTTEVQEWILGWRKWWEDTMKEYSPDIVDVDKSLKEVVSETIKVSNR